MPPLPQPPASPPPAGRDADPLDAIRAGFFVECEDLLESLRDAIAAFESAGRGRTRPDPETIHVAFRAVHSVKGGAAAFALGALVDFAHGLEHHLDRLREDPASPPPLATIDAMQRAADHLADHIRAARDGTAPPSDDAPILAAFAAAADPAAAAGRQTLVFRPHDGLYASGNEPFFLLQALAGLGATAIRCDSDDLPGLDTLLPERNYLAWRMDLPADLAEAEIRDVFDFVEDLCDLTLSANPPASTRPPEAPPSPPATAPSAPASATAPRPAGVTSGDDPAPTMRIAMDRIDRLMNLVGEMAINQSILSQQLASAGLTAHAPLAAGLDALAGLTRDIQDGVMTMRAQPVKPLFQRMGGILRSTAASLGKPARLLTIGETTEIDRSVIDRLVDPLTHMIRNAVDHGLEPVEARRAAGKPAEGTVTLAAAHRAGRVVIELSDDGGGIDRAGVRAIARTRGLLAPDATPDDAETDQLLFRPGFSTAGHVSDVSGRGVGLDVLRSAIAGLGGRIAVASEPGRGTRFTLSLPLTLAVLDGMVVRAGGQTLVVPVATALETAALRALDRRRLGAGPGRMPGPELVRMQGGFAPLCDVAAILGYRPAAAAGSGDETGDKTGGGAGGRAGGRVVILTQAEDGRRAALLVDAILDQRQVVIKPIRGGLPAIPGIAAATILGDGRVALILDPAELAGAAAATTALAEVPGEVVWNDHER